MKVSTTRQETKRSGTNVLDAIENRRAVRDYTSRKVEELLIRKLLKYATYAPSAVNSQPWSFVVIQNRDILKHISEASKENIRQNPNFNQGHEYGFDKFIEENFDIFYGANTLIVICSVECSLMGFSAEADCFLAAQNLMLAAYGLGLATCPIGLARATLQTNLFRTMLKIPENIKPVLPIIVGYSTSNLEKVSRRLPLIHSWHESL